MVWHSSRILFYFLRRNNRLTALCSRRPLPLNTVALQKLASRKLRMSSERVMKVAEDLYRAGKISYPRTETDSFTAGTDLRGLVQQQTEHPQWGAYAQG